MDESKVREAIELLEALGGDLRKLAELDEPLRIRLVSAAGQLSRPDRYSRKALGKVLALVGAAFGLFVASYTGVLLAVTNRPIWADTQFLGVLFLASAASTAAATLILLALWRRESGAHASTIEFLAWFDGWALILELVVLAFFLLSLGSIASVWLSWRGIVLLLFVVVLGILIPQTLQLRPHFMGERLHGNRIAVGAVLVLIGGFMLRFIILIGSETIQGPHTGIQMTSTVPWP